MTTEHSLRDVGVLDLESQPPLLVHDGDSVGDVIRAMRESSLGYALITREDSLVGIFTERDVLLAILGNERSLQQPVSHYMSSSPTCVSASDPVSRVVACMHDGGFRQVPVVDEHHKVLACVRHKDIAGYLVNHYADHILNLPPDPEQMANTPEGG